MGGDDDERWACEKRRGGSCFRAEGDCVDVGLKEVIRVDDDVR